MAPTKAQRHSPSIEINISKNLTSQQPKLWVSRAVMKDIGVFSVKDYWDHPNLFFSCGEYFDFVDSS